MKITNVTRPSLFYNKYDTKLTIEAKGIGWVRWYRTVDDLWRRVQSEQVEQYRYTRFSSQVAGLTRDDVVKIFSLNFSVSVIIVSMELFNVVNTNKSNSVSELNNSICFEISL